MKDQATRELAADLLQAPGRIHPAQLRYIEAEATWREIRTVDVPRVAANPAQREAMATLAAIREGRIDGKNEAQRAAQTAEVLEASDEVRQARRELEGAQLTLIGSETEMRLAEAERDYDVNRMRALLAVTNTAANAPRVESEATQ